MNERERHRRYVQANREKVYISNRVWLLSHPKKRMLYSARARAKRLGIECTISEADFEIPEVCPISGKKLIPAHGHQKDDSPSLDRVDNSLGYIPGNIQVISYRANRWKSNMSKLDLQRLYDYVFAR